MPSDAGLEHRLDITYRYFSHHIRTCTSVVVAMLDAVAEGLTDESMTAMIMESGYLLDIYDRGMSVCFNHILNKPHNPTIEKVNIVHLIDLYKNNAVSDESPAEIVCGISSMTVSCDGYSFKSFFQILLQEGLASAKNTLEIKREGNEISILPDNGYNEIQPIFHIFKEIFEKSGITMIFDQMSIKLRFTDESIDS